LGRQSQASSVGQKGVCTPQAAWVRSRSACKARQALFPNPGKTCGRREREAETGSRTERSGRARLRNGGKHPVSGMTAPFAGLRWNEDLGRSVLFVEVSSSAGIRTDDNRCSLDAEEGNVVSSSPKSASTHDRRIRRTISGTRPSLGPKARARQSPLHFRRKSSGGALGEESRSGKLAQAGGTGTGVDQSGRSAARRAPRTRKRHRDASEKEGGCGLRPCEESRARVAVPVRRSSCRSRWAAFDLEYARASAPKRAAARVNRDLGRGHRRR
jgi:hypothetical protein